MKFVITVERTRKLLTTILFDWSHWEIDRLYDWGVSDCSLMPTQQFFSYIMASTGSFSMR